MSWSKYFCGMAFVAIAKCTQEKCPRLNSVSVGCLSKICFLYCRWKAEFSSELPIKLPLHQVGSSNNILNKICHGNGLGFPSQAEATRSCSFCLSHLLSLNPPHQQAHSLHFFPDLSLSLSSFSLFFTLFLPSSSSFPAILSLVIFLRVFPVASSGLGPENYFRIIIGAWEQILSVSCSLQLAAIPRQNGNTRISVIYFT